jgi:hypothetical protein
VGVLAVTFTGVGVGFRLTRAEVSRVGRSDADFVNRCQSACGEQVGVDCIGSELTAVNLGCFEPPALGLVAVCHQAFEILPIVMAPSPASMVCTAAGRFFRARSALLRSLASLVVRSSRVSVAVSRVN